MPPSTTLPSPTQANPYAGMDMGAINLAKAIRQTESGGDFNAKGASGESGAYQWTPATWQAQAQQILGDPKAAMTPANQNAVAYGIIKTWKDQGLNAAEIAAKWNSGSSTGWENKIGTNSYGVKYNVPQYVKSVTDAYQTIKAGGNVGIDPNNPSSIGNTSTSNQAPSIQGFLENIFGSAGKLVGGLGEAALHPIQTVETLGSTAAGALEKPLGINNADTQHFDNLVNYFGQRYGGNSLPQIVTNIGHTLYTDPVGAALDLSTLLDGVGAVAGGVGKLADVSRATDLANAADYISTTSGVLKGGSPEAIRALQNPGALTKIADAVKTVADYTNPLTAVGKTAKFGLGIGARVVGESLGLSTGTGYGAIKGAFEAGNTGGEAQSAFRAGISGGENGGDALLQSAQDAFQKIKNERQTAYQTQLEAIKTGSHALTTEAIQPIFDKFDQLLHNFDVIKNTDGTLDFSNSRLESEGGSISDIRQINNELEKYRQGLKQINPANIDHLKTFITDRYTFGTRGSAFTTPLADTVRTVLKDRVPGYEKLTGDYAQASADLKSLKDLSLGGRAGKETIIRKLTSAMRGNNEYRRVLLQELENKSGNKVVSQAAGVALSKLAPAGLTKYTEGLAAVLHPSLLLALPFESPRLVGEFINALGKGNRVLENIGNAFIRYKGPTALKVGTLINQANLGKQ